MTRHRRALAVGLAALAFVRIAAAEDFAQSVSDLPIMPGMTESAASAVVFDKPDGRIAEIEAGGAVDPAAVADFYRRTLPQLGWRPDSTDPRAMRFVRENETLSVSVAARPSGGATVHLSLAPR